MNLTEKIYAGAALAGILVLALAGIFIWRKGASAAARSTVDFAGNATAGVVKGIGDQLGIPDTDVDKCVTARAEGRTFDASKYCPASVFIGYLFGSDEAQPTATTRTGASPAPASSAATPAPLASSGGIIDTYPWLGAGL